MTDPAWLQFALSQIGVREIPGAPTAPAITAWLNRLRAWWADDETPWCGVFVAACMQHAGISLASNWMRAKAWLDWGLMLSGPCVGAVVVFERQGGGHVGFVVGRDTRGRLLVLGGNQGDSVKVSPFDIGRVVGYRWPEGVNHPAVGWSELPVMAATAPVSTNEA